jgi:hypothetical protein
MAQPFTSAHDSSMRQGMQVRNHEPYNRHGLTKTLCKRPCLTAQHPAAGQCYHFIKSVPLLPHQAAAAPAQQQLQVAISPALSRHRLHTPGRLHLRAGAAGAGRSLAPVPKLIPLLGGGQVVSPGLGCLKSLLGPGAGAEQGINNAPQGTDGSSSDQHEDLGPGHQVPLRHPLIMQCSIAFLGFVKRQAVPAPGTGRQNAQGTSQGEGCKYKWVVSCQPQCAGR